MKADWKDPSVEALTIEQTADNIVWASVEDLIKAGDLGNNPQGYQCTADCS